MITIEVKVYGGLAPVPINVTISEQNNLYNNDFSKDKSFKEKLELPRGIYEIVVSGQNPYNPDGNDKIRTEIKVYGKTGTGNINLKKVKTVEEYSAGFSFSI